MPKSSCCLICSRHSTQSTPPPPSHTERLTAFFLQKTQPLGAPLPYFSKTHYMVTSCLVFWWPCAPVPFSQPFPNLRGIRRLSSLKLSLPRLFLLLLACTWLYCYAQGLQAPSLPTVHAGPCTPPICMPPTPSGSRCWSCWFSGNLQRTSSGAAFHPLTIPTLYPEHEVGQKPRKSPGLTGE